MRVLELKQIKKSGLTWYVSQKINTKARFGCESVNEPFLTLSIVGPSSKEVNVATHNAVNVTLHKEVKQGYSIRELLDIAKQFMYKNGASQIHDRNESFFTIGQKCIPTYFVRMLHGEPELNAYAEYGLLSDINITAQEIPDHIREEIKFNNITNSAELHEFCTSSITNFLYDLKNSNEVLLCGLHYNLTAINAVLRKYEFTQAEYFADVFRRMREVDRSIIILALFDIYNLSQLCNFIDDTDTYAVYFKHAEPALNAMGIAPAEVKTHINSANMNGVPITYNGLTKATNLILFFAIYTYLVQNNEVVYTGNTRDRSRYLSMAPLYTITKFGGFGLFADFIMN